MMPLERREWFKVARAVATPEFWTCTCRPDGVAYGWYLDKVRVSRCLRVAVAAEGAAPRVAPYR